MADYRKEVTVNPSVSLINLFNSEELTYNETKAAFEAVFGFEARLVAGESIQIILNQAVKCETQEQMVETLNVHMKTLDQLIKLTGARPLF